ncbi:MAG: BolA family transcriptional regulator [Methylococcaceae bacterium]|nr:BolA family transcriptional regulator [Methylococcaceae bacterium]MCI0732674.1 BolA family transcriptional regulator [Methylococcaceae bacterium]
MTRLEKIKSRIDSALAPERLEVIDDSESHAGHAGVREQGGGHFLATIVSTLFEGKSLIQRHQLVYQALGDLMQSDIHAFSIKAYTPNEIKGK